MGLINQTAQAYYNGNDYGNYQFVSLEDIINQFMFVYVGEDKIIPKARRTDVAFHAQRALAELSFDTLKSCKAQEITVPASLQMTLPQDYVNYTKISWVDSAGIKHLLYPTSKTSNPPNPLQNSDGDFVFEPIVDLTSGSTQVVMDGLFYFPYGTRVTGLQIDNVAGGPWDVVGFSHSSNTTVLTLQNTTSSIFFISSVTAKEKLTFPTIGGSLYPNYTDGARVGVNAWSASQYTITASTSDLDGLKVGMLLHDNGAVWDQGTTVVNIDGASILLSNPTIVANPSSTTLSFTSLETKDSDTWSNYKSNTPSENQDDYQDDTYWPLDGSRFGLDPQHAQANGSFYIDCKSGKIHFSSNISGKTVILDYISDSLGTDGEMQVHKFAEEAMYKWITHAILAGKANVPEYQVNRFKKERFAAIRTAKLRLSNLKLEELTQILRGKSKQIKH
jgi:hypothetical protein